MSAKFKIDKAPYVDDERIYKKSNISLEPGVTVLVGCNGSGKTTLLRHIAQVLKKTSVPVLQYDNLTEGGHSARSAAIFWGDTNTAGALMTSSEGEQISINMCNIAQKMGRFVRDNKGAKALWFLFDAIDSGLSVDNVVEIKQLLFKTVIEDNPNSDVYIIVSANEYEMCNGEQCFDVRNGKYVSFNSYDEYRSFIMQSRQEKDNR